MKPILHENLRDGVNKENFIQLDPSNTSILVSGSSSQNASMGPSMAFKDVTGDGLPDLVVGAGRGFIFVYELQSKLNAFPLIFKPAHFIHAFCGHTPNIDVVDMNADGNNDIVVGQANGNLSWIRNLGNGVFVKPNTPPLLIPIFGKSQPYIGKITAPRMFDWNNDSNFDLIYGEGSYSANSVYLLLNQSNNSNPNFINAKRNWLAYGMGREQLIPSVGDLNNDGQHDLIVGDRLGHINWYAHSPTNADPSAPFLLALKQELSFGGKSPPLKGYVHNYLADVDGDKDLDIFLSDSSGFVYISRNIGSPEVPDFAKPIKISSSDRLKPYMYIPNWPLHGGFNHGAKAEALSETSTKFDKTLRYIRVSYVDGYIGVGVSLNHYLANKIEFAKPYSISFKARGKKMFVALSISQDGVSYADGDTKRHKSADAEKFNFNLTTEWSTHSFSFRKKKIFPKSPKKTTGIGIHFGINNVLSKSDGFFEIADVKIIQR